MRSSTRSIFAIFIATVAALGIIAYVASASGGGAGDVEIHPLSEITASGPDVTNITPTSGILDLVTTIPVACSVVYGTDGTYGQIAVDPDMAGAAITEHHPIMGNLQPNTVYQYRMQGSDENGILYVSEVFSFTTPIDPNNEVNLASLEDGAVVLDVSSNFGGAANNEAWGANKAIDNSENSAWATAGDGNASFVEVQLVQAGDIHAISVWSREMGDGSSRVIDFTVTSNMGESFSFTLPDADQAYRFDTPFTMPVTSIRFDVDTGTGGNMGLQDFDVFTTAGSLLDADNFLPILQK